MLSGRLLRFEEPDRSQRDGLDTLCLPQRKARRRSACMLSRESCEYRVLVGCRPSILGRSSRTRGIGEAETCLRQRNLGALG